MKGFAIATMLAAMMVLACVALMLLMAYGG